MIAGAAIVRWVSSTVSSARALRGASRQTATLTMRRIDRDLDRILNLLRTLIRERGYTQLEVQEVLGWGRSYISQLLTAQKSLRVEHVLMILKVIDVKPEVFFAELYDFGTRRPRHRPARPTAPSRADVLDRTDLRRLQRLFDGLVSVLEDKDLITAEDLGRAIEKAKMAVTMAEELP